ncbi:UBX domain, partial [Rhizoctonia solani]
MTLSKYLSERVSWDPPLAIKLPQLAIPSIFCRAPRAAGHAKSRVADIDDSSTEITVISYPPGPTKSRRIKLRRYMRQISRLFTRRTKPQEETVSEPAQVKPDILNHDMLAIHSIFQLPRSTSSLTTPSSSPTSYISPTLDPVMFSQLQVDRAIRVEQDAAYKKTQDLDRGRLEKLREERIRDEDLRQKHAEQEEQEKNRECLEAVRRRAQNDWRRWARRALVPTFQGRDTVEFAVRLHCGQRRIGRLPPDASAEMVYLLVETLLIPPSFSPEDDPELPPEGYEHHWEFRLVTTHARFVLPNDAHLKLYELDIMKKGVLFIAEEAVNHNRQPEGMLREA